MPSANTKAWISVLLASSAIPAGLCAPMDAGPGRKPPAPALLDVDVDVLDGILARGPPSPAPPALLDADIDILDGILARDLHPPPPALPLPAPLGPNVGVPPAITKRDAVATDAQLAKRYLIGSPYQKRTIQVALKKAVHG